MAFTWRLPTTIPQTSGETSGLRIDRADPNSVTNKEPLTALLYFRGSGALQALQGEVDSLTVGPLTEAARQLAGRSGERKQVSACRDRLAEAKRGLESLQAAIRTAEEKAADPVHLTSADPGATLANLDAQLEALRRRLGPAQGAVQARTRELQIAEGKLRQEAAERATSGIEKLWKELETRRRAALAKIQDLAAPLLHEAATAELGMVQLRAEKQLLLHKIEGELERSLAGPEETEATAV